MKDLLIMRKLICFLLVWNLLLTGALLIRFDKTQETKLNTEICILEEIPMEELR